MKNQNEQVWIGIEDKTQDSAFLEIAKQEFVSLTDTFSDEEAIANIGSNRRDFLKYLGFGLGAATIAASCDIPVKKALPYVTKPDAIVPGVANYYASSFVEGGDYAAILVKTREGRPIKIEGNGLSNVTKGATSARVQAAVLSLYDSNRLRNAGTVGANGVVKKTTWANIDAAVMSKLSAGGQVRILTGTVLSPSAKAVLTEFTTKYPNTKVIASDPVSAAAILLANEVSFGDKVIPSYHFDKANVIVSLGADFLGTWVSPIEYAHDYAKNRKIVDENNVKMSRHYQVESYMSMTGSNADNRILIKPSEQGAAIATLYNEVAALTGGAGASAPALTAKAAKALKGVAADLVAAKGASLVISNSNNVGEQVLVNAINNLLGNYGTTIDLANGSLQRQGDDTQVQALIGEMNSGAVSALLVWGTNPVFELANGDQFKAAMAKVPVRVAMGQLMDETAAACTHVAPTNHLLESWGDAQPKRGQFSIIQPTIAPLFETRQAEHSFLTWAGSPNLNAAAAAPYYEYVKSNWQKTMFTKQKSFATPTAFWDSCLHDGVFAIPQVAKATPFKGDVSAAAASINQPLKGGEEVTFYETINMGNGQYANNPWLQEMPDPVMRTVWGNYLSVPIKFDGVNDFEGYNSLKDGDFAEIEVNGKKQKVTVVRQFGQPEGTAAIGIGHGREVVGPCGKGIGANVQGMRPIVNGLTQNFANIKVSGKVGDDKDFACVQHHHTMGVTAMGKEEGVVINADEKSLGYKGFQGSLTSRSVIRKAHVDDLKKFVVDLQEERAHHQHLNKTTLYPGHDNWYKLGVHWGMHIDLNACTGCGACTVACMSENNVPVVGRHEVKRHHEMSWLRIDRYFYGDVENPATVYQPMMCQHCDNAPCENVCPVAATNHSHEGLNQMTYNRCIGTRYCANNCPYKVRRFNWLDYTSADLFGSNEHRLNGEDTPFYMDNLTRMVLNPDVTVRTHGVIEKCSMCVQRIQEGKLTAKRESRGIRDGEIKTACQTACPTAAITFGDQNNPETSVSKKKKSLLNYIVLEEVNVQPNVVYTARINNKNEKLEA
jgi:MoCo/4Fe-4S cofactor protein with predicted Tat translocation signal